MNISALSQLQGLLTRAFQSPYWVVLLCATKEEALQYREGLAFWLPVGTQFSGRTASSCGRHVSVVSVTEDFFLPPGVPFLLGYLGAGSAYAQEARTWSSKAKGFL